MIGNDSGMYFDYSIRYNNSENPTVYGNNIRCVLPWTEDKKCIFYEMFSFDLPKGEECILDFSIVIPNVGLMGVYNMLYAE